MPCNLLPWSKQVVPTVLHSSSNTPAFKPPSCCGLDHSILPSAMPGISLNDFSSLTTFIGRFSALALSAVALTRRGCCTPHQAETSRRKGGETLMLSPVGVTSPCQTGCLSLLGLAGGAWMLLHNLTSTPQISCIPKKARDRHIVL